MDNFVQPHLGKFGFRAKKLLVGVIYYLVWELALFRVSLIIAGEH